jgi:predicted GIY-YIG superfamily endonuclease
MTTDMNNSSISNNSSPLFIYVLKLNEDKYYVGKTVNNITQRMEEHMAGNGSAWTQKYTPIEVMEVKTGDEYDEDKYVLKYMKQYGIENVRGGSFSQIILPFDQHVQAWRSIQNASCSCTACGKHDHAIESCSSDICYKCGQSGHLFTACTAQTHVMGGRIDGCFRCGRPDHWAIRCNRSKDFLGRPILQHTCNIQ